MKTMLKGCLSIGVILSLTAVMWAEMPPNVTVSLPVVASVESVTLDPGNYTMAIEGFNGKTATVKIFREGSSKEQVSAPVTAFQPDEPVRKTAIKVTSRSGSYLLDKLV